MAISETNEGIDFIPFTPLLALSSIAKICPATILYYTQQTSNCLTRS